ncbi:MAG: matrixin family metalloprotease [Gemmatimonadaceae bacterium]|nr:matrixin family metalloprotease [Gemmatimonadaceae bacterium]
MKNAETLLACCVVGLACFIGGQAVGIKHAGPVRDHAAGAIEIPGSRMAPNLSGPGAEVSGAPLALGNTSAAAPHAQELLVANSLLTPAEMPRLSPADMRQRVAQGANGTYVHDVLISRDSALARWPDRTGRPLRVWVQEAEQLEPWTPEFLPSVRDAFDTWVQSGIPVRFTFVIDSATADVRVTFVPGFSTGISGRTVWSRDASYWMVSSDIQLAVSDPSGNVFTPPQMRAIALHEVGHLLGLDHAASAEDIMSPRIRVRELSERDKQTVRLIYSLPAGSLR